MSVMSVAPAGVRPPAGALSLSSLPEHHPGRNPTIMTDQPARVTPGEISALLDQARRLTRDAPLADRIAHHERKARLLSRVAAHLDTAEAHRVAADAWHQVGMLARQRDQKEVG
jgi:hypothetical protein